MADVKAVDGAAEFPEKRKIDLPSSISKSLEENKDEPDSNKRQKIEVPSQKNGSISPLAGEKAAESDDQVNDSAALEEEDEENGDDEEDYNAAEDDDGDEDVNEERAEVVDRKGKGIMIDDKGKGKMLEDSEDDDSDGHDDDDDDSSDDSDSDFSDGLGGSDLDDDPLAEVDLSNILPSRTRQRQAQRGVRIFGDTNKGNDV